MKTKSVFISTIAMVVLLVVALATGTWAWYSAQETATATGATVSAVKSENASIGLSWTGSDYLPSVAFGTGNDIGPMIPTAALASFVGVPATNGPTFTQSAIANNGTNDYFKANGTSGTPWREVEPGELTQGTLRIKNLDFTTASSVSTSVSIPQTANTNADILRVAIFIEQPSGTYTLIGVWGPVATSKIWFGTITLGANVGSIQSANEGANFISPTSTSTPFILEATQDARVHVYAWLEGTILNSQRSLDANYGDATFQITFTAEEYTAP